MATIGVIEVVRLDIEDGTVAFLAQQLPLPVHKGLKEDGHEGRRDAVAGGVGQVEADPAVIEHEVIDEITAIASAISTTPRPTNGNSSGKGRPTASLEAKPRSPAAARFQWVIRPS